MLQVNFRMPASLKTALERAAEGNNRTLTAEITYRLSASLEDDKKAWDGDGNPTMDALAKNLEHLLRVLAGGDVDLAELRKALNKMDKPPSA